MGSKSVNVDHTLAEYLTVLWFFLCILLIFMIWKFANRNQFNWHTYIAIFIAYFCSFGIIALIPIDIGLTIYGRRENLDPNEESTYSKYSGKIEDMYNSLYWPAFILGSFFLFWQENFNQDYHFTLKDRFKGSVQRMAKLWGTMAIAGITILIILVAGGLLDGSSDAIKTTCILLANTYGLVAISILLGYGLAELPMMLWRKSEPEKQLETIQTKAANAFKRMADNSFVVSSTVCSIHKTIDELKRKKHSRDAELEHAIELILADIPLEFENARVGGEVMKNKDGKVTLEELAQLRRQLHIDKTNYFTSRTKVERLKKHSYYLEDVIESRHRDVQKIQWSFGLGESSHREWLWHCRIRPHALRLLSIFAWTMSFFVWFGLIGVIAGYKSNISILSLVVHDENASVAGVTIFVLFTLGYIAYTTMWSLFQMRIANMMDIVPDQHTTPKSFSFNARQVAKLCAPLVYLYLGLIYETGNHEGSWKEDHNGNILESGFSRFYGTIEVMPFLGDSFNLFFPLVIIILSFLQVLNVFNRLLIMLHLENLQFGEVEVTESQLKEGKKQLARDKKRMERAAKRDMNRQKIDKLRRRSFSDVLTGENTKDDVEDQILQSAHSFDPPSPLHGWGEIKSGRFKMTASWQQAYFHVQAPGELLACSSETDSNPEQIIDLRTVVTITNHMKKDKIDHERLDITTAMGLIEIRFETAEICADWRESLISWQDWAVCFSPDNTNGDGGLYEKTDGKKDSYHDLNKQNEDDIEVQLSLLSHEQKQQQQYDTNNNNKKKKENTTDMNRIERELSLSDIVIPGEEEFDLSDLRTGTTTTTTTTNTTSNEAYKRKTSLGFNSKPSILLGYLDKKSSNRLQPWKSKYCEVKEENATLTYWKTNDTSQAPQGEIDLRLVTDISFQKGRKGNVQDKRTFILDCGNQQYIFRAKDQLSGQKWLDSLEAWREYFLFNYTPRNDDNHEEDEFKV